MLRLLIVHAVRVGHEGKAWRSGERFGFGFVGIMKGLRDDSLPPQ